MNYIDGKCMACYQTIDHCQGGHGEICEDCDGFKAGPHEALCPVVRGLSWVCITDQGEEASMPLVDWFANDAAAALQYLLNWDFGEETDAGGTYTPPNEAMRHGLPALSDHALLYPWGEYDEIHEVMEYVWVQDYQRGNISLYRRAMS